MSHKWHWMLLLWHNWRAAVWHAETFLYPVEHHAGGLISRPFRHAHAESLRDWHSREAREHRRVLFPPEPLDWDLFKSRIKR